MTANKILLLITDLPLMAGDGKGKFFPNDNITYIQAVKILVSTVGYDIVAQQKGGYPDGFMAVGADTQITRGITLSYDSEIDMSAAAQLIYNTMNVDILSVAYNEKMNYKVNLGSTLMNNKLEKNNLIVRRGIVTSNSATNFDDSVAFHKDEITIDNDRYKNGGKNYDELLGYAVEAYIISDGSGYKTIKCAFKLPNVNSKLVIASEDIVDFQIEQITFDVDENKHSQKARIASNAVYIYNGRPLSSVTADDLLPKSGSVTLISNDSDDIYDVVIIEDSRSFVVRSVSDTNKIIHFKEFTGQAVTFKGRPAIYLHDDDYIISITDDLGKPISLTDISEDDVVTITESKDGKYIKIIVTRNSVTGILQEIADSSVVIDGKEYPLNQSNGYKPITEVQIGDRALFYLDAYGKIIMSEKLGNEELIYAYVVDVKPAENRLNNTLQLKLMHKASMEKVVDKYDSTKITYILRNGEMKVLTLKDKAKVDGTKLNNISNLDLKGRLILYSTDSNGQIDCIEFPELYNRPLGYTFNSKLVSFGGQLEGGFIINDRSAVICVPISGKEEDYYQQVKLRNGDTYNILGYDVDEVTSIAKGAVITANMSATGSDAINNESDVAIIKSISQVLNENGDKVYRVVLLDDTTEKILDFNDNDSVIAVAEGLQIGDLINYTQDVFNRVNGIKLLARPTEYKSPTLIRESQTDEEVYGYVSSVKVNSFHSKNNEMVDRIIVQYDEKGLTKEYIIPHEETPPIYYYRRATKTVTNIKPEDFIPRSIAGDKASSIFMAVCEGVVRAVVIIE